MSACFDDHDVLQFVAGTVTDEQRATMLEHVETCAACHSLIAELLDEESQRALAALPAVRGPYRIEGAIARGGMGEIFRATDTELGRQVAIKVPRVGSSLLVRRFEREVAITARLQHPGIVPLHGAGKLDDGTPFYVMRYIEGRTLDEEVAAALTFRDRLALVQRLVTVAETMAYVHGENIVHRDLKPNNVLLGRFGETVIIDWGLAKALDEPAPRLSLEAIPSPSAIPPTPLPSLRTTRAGDVLGTPAFMAPEQAAGQAVTPRSDVYALGRMIAFVVTGRLGEPDVAQWEPAAAHLAPIVTRATAVDPAERFADAGELASALRAALSPRPSRRIPWNAIAAIVAIAIVAIASILILGNRSRQETPTLEPLGVARTNLVALAVSPSGRRVAAAGTDWIEVRDIATGRTWQRSGWVAWPRHIVFEGEDAVGFHGSDRRDADEADRHHARWNLVTDAVERVAPVKPGWVGALAGGELYLQVAPQGVWPVIVRADGERRELQDVRYPVNQIKIAPDGKRFAFVDGVDRHRSVLRIVDAAGASVVSPPLTDITAIGWDSDSTIVYATGMAGMSTLWRVRATREGLARPARLFERTGADQWIGAIGAVRDRIVVAIVSSTYETHTVDLADARTQRLHETHASAVIAWRDASTVVAWNRSAERLENRPLDPTALATPTSIKLSGEPSTSTSTASLFVVGQRTADARRVIALDRDTGATRWELRDNAPWFVRCAGDRAEPCIAGVGTTDGLTEVRRIDIATGTVGDVVVAAANINDAALDATGTTIAWVVDGGWLHVRALSASGQGDVNPSFLGSTQSLAFLGDTRELVMRANTRGTGIYRATATAVELVRLIDEAIVSLVRSSPDGTRFSYRTRTLTSQPALLQLP